MTLSERSDSLTTFRIKTYQLTEDSDWVGVELAADSRIIAQWIGPPDQIPEMVRICVGNFYAFVESRKETGGVG